jgi:pectinesterase
VRNGYNADRVQLGRNDDPLNAAGQFINGQHQAVAVLIAGADKVHLDHVRLPSYQDTLYFKASAPAITSRSFYSWCFIEGDVDFILVKPQLILGNAK